MTSCFWSPTMSSFSVSALNLAQELQVRNLGFLLAWLLGDCGSGTCHLTSLLQLSIATYKTTQNLMAYNNNCFIMSHNFMGRKFKHVFGGWFFSTWSQMGPGIGSCSGIEFPRQLHSQAWGGIALSTPGLSTWLGWTSSQQDSLRTVGLLTQKLRCQEGVFCQEGKYFSSTFLSSVSADLQIKWQKTD